MAIDYSPCGDFSRCLMINICSKMSLLFLTVQGIPEIKLMDQPDMRQRSVPGSFRWIKSSASRAIKGQDCCDVIDMLTVPFSSD